MAYENLKNAIMQVIKQNGNQEITGSILQNALLNMIDNTPEVVQTIGGAEDKVMSQKVVSDKFSDLTSEMSPNNLMTFTQSTPLSISTLSDGDIEIKFNKGWNNYSSKFTSNELFTTTGKELFKNASQGWYAVVFKISTKTFTYFNLQFLDKSYKSDYIYLFSCDCSNMAKISRIHSSGFAITEYNSELYLSIGPFDKWLKYSDLAATTEKSDATIFQIGDSITFQKDNKKDDDPVTNPYIYKGNGFMRYVCNKLGIPANKHFTRGQNGQTIVGYAKYLQANPAAFPKSSANLSKLIWVIELGTNDWGHETQATDIGDKSDYVNKTGNNTVYGALRTIVDYILPDINANEQAPHVIMLTPMDRGAYSNNSEASWRPCSFSYDSNGDIVFTKNYKNHTIDDYAEAIRWVCKREGFICVDFLENPICLRKYFNKALSFGDCTMKSGTNYPEVYQDIYGDNLHPTDKGDKMMGQFILEKTKHIFINV